ncbi:protein FAM169B isoform X2 [Archocentrus centrarchus]|uniref:protein FAM169B isoform X2 n=1 Tax=Archocentrus centrarchus TaxID=63155 RepID=UPI0011EA43CD|nr:uncharacterized protein LOC115781821 isoform X2 [Archocentrus centrarchus]
MHNYTKHLPEAMYPVDLPAVDHKDLTSASERYLSSLESRPPGDEWFHSSHTSKVAITAANVSQLQLFEDGQPGCAVLALHPPDDPTQVVALYLHGKWWLLDDVLRTSSRSRSGLVSVQSLMERVIVFLLSQIMERPSLFSLHPPTESCKVLWRDSQAVGFYTVKHKVFRRFLQKHRQHRERLYEVEAPGGWTQRRNIWLNIQLGRYSLGTDEESSPTSGQTQRNPLKDASDPDPDPDSQRTCLLDLSMLGAPDGNTAVLLGATEQQIESCDPSRGGRSLSGELPGTGWSPAAQTDDLKSGPPTQPSNTTQALKSKASPSTKHHREEPEDMQNIPKRARIHELKQEHGQRLHSAAEPTEAVQTLN